MAMPSRLAAEATEQGPRATMARIRPRIIVLILSIDWLKRITNRLSLDVTMSREHTKEKQLHEDRSDALTNRAVKPARPDRFRSPFVT
jgi:hypothetical protein